MGAKFRARGPEQAQKRTIALCAAVALLVMGGMALIPATAQAATITVNTLSDPAGASGTCSLREAITNANSESQSGSTNCAAGTGNDTIVFASNLISGTTTVGTITLTSALPAIEHTLTIDGNITGANTTGGNIAISGNKSYQVLYVNSTATVVLDNLTITKSYSAAALDTNGPGGIYNGGTLTLNNSIVTGNSTVSGAGIYNDAGGELTINNSTISNNSASNFGGAIENKNSSAATSVTITGSTISGNSAGADGGGISNPVAGTINITGSTISGNFGPGAGGIDSGVSSSLTVTDSTFSNNFLSGSPSGAGGIDSGGSLTVTDSTFSNNKGSEGGAIEGSGYLNVTGSTFSNNSASTSGGAIYDSASGSISNSTFSNNTTSGNGGGIYNATAGYTLPVSGSTFYGNTASNAGGGIYNDAGTLTVTNSTFYGNDAVTGGGVETLNTLTVTNATFEGNTGSIYNDGGSVSLEGTILDSASGYGSCEGGAVANDGYNISSDGTCGFIDYTLASNGGETIGDNVDPLLSTSGVANNGGPTFTIALQPGSPAIDAMPIGSCPSIDQRGVMRGDTGESYCDIGAYEFEDSSVPFTNFSGKLTLKPSTGSFDLTSSFTPGSGGTIDLSTQAVTLGLGGSTGYSVTVPAGSFLPRGGNSYVFDAAVNSVPIEMKLALQSNGSYSFGAKGSGANLSGITSNPVTVTLSFRSTEVDSGTTSVTASFK